MCYEVQGFKKKSLESGQLDDLVERKLKLKTGSYQARHSRTNGIAGLAFSLISGSAFSLIAGVSSHFWSRIFSYFWSGLAFSLISGLALSLIYGLVFFLISGLASPQNVPFALLYVSI